MEEIISIDDTQSQEIGSLALALSKAQGAFNGANKSSANPFFKSKYADLHECIEAVKGPLSENELAIIQTTRPNGKDIDIITTLAHSSGEWIRGVMRMTPKKDDDQGRGSSITYGRRYALAAIVGIAQKDDDGNGACEQKKQQKPDSMEESCKRVLTVIAEFEDKHTEDITEWWSSKITPILDKYSPSQQKQINTAHQAMVKKLAEKELTEA